VLLAGIRRERAKPAAQPSFPSGALHALPEQPRFPGAFPNAWMVPYQRNPFFTGREEVLKNLYDALRVGKTVAVVQPRALTGLGGIGKTQTAVEYAYRYYSDYPEAILWARADSREGLVTDFVAMAHALNLPEKEKQDQNLVIDAVKRWLKEHANWLLILDNVEDLVMIKNVLPSAYRGHILLTTRMQATGGTARSVEIEQMESEEGTLFLLRRATMLAPDALLNAALEADKVKAQAITLNMGGLPLALDQAGAYIEETGCSLSDYLDFFEQRRAKLLQRRGPSSSDHPESIATTWSLSFEQVEQANPAAAELLRFCAFLHPDAIPEEVITEGAPVLGPILEPIAADLPELNEAIGILFRFSLVRRDRGTKLLSIHRLVQAVLIDDMDNESLHLWAERTVRAIIQTLPLVDYQQWPTIAPRWQRCLAQALTCAKLINQEHIWDVESAAFLRVIGFYLYLCGQFTEAEPLFRNSLIICEQVLGPGSSGVCTCLTDLGLNCKAQGRYEEAEQFHRQALACWEKIFGPKSSDVATSLNNIAFVYKEIGKYVEAEALSKQSLAIREQVLGPEDLNVAYNFKLLGELYNIQGKYSEAETAFRRVLAIRERALGPDHPWVGESLQALGSIYHEQGKYDLAEPLYFRALAIREQAPARGEKKLSQHLYQLGLFHHEQGKYAEAEHLFLRALAINEQALGSDDQNIAVYLSNLGLFHHEQGRYVEAEPLYLRALSIEEKINNLQTQNGATYLNNLAKLYYDQGRYVEAEPLYLRALSIEEKINNLQTQKGATYLNNLAKLYHDQGKYVEAEPLYQRAMNIFEKTTQLIHPEGGLIRGNYAKLYHDQGRYAEAEPLFQQALEIGEQVLGPEDLDMANILENYAALLRKTKREAEAEEFETRVKVIRAKK